jgi:hypothetical protein
VLCSSTFGQETSEPGLPEMLVRSEDIGQFALLQHDEGHAIDQAPGLIHTLAKEIKRL